MWYLQGENGKRVYLTLFKELTFGRKNCEIILPNDESISKTHAIVYLEPRQVVQANEPISMCSIADKGSKYGTYIFRDNTKICVSEEKHALNNGDIIRFGLKSATFKVVYVQIITVVSTLNDTDKGKLQNLMDHIDGMISTEWINNCTHVTVSKATLTEKVTWALASAVPIVTIDYWVEVKNSVDRNQELPKIEKFVPLISEPLIDRDKLLLYPNEKRKTLFRNLVFVHFSTNQFKIYGKMIHLAGGKSILYSKRPLSNTQLYAPNVIVVQYPDSDATDMTQCTVPGYDSICKILQEYRRKMIPESEIPLAILHCSIEKYCNPKFSFLKFLKRSQPQPDTSDVLVLDTQDVDAGSEGVPEIISKIPSQLNLNKKVFHKAVEIIPETYDDFNSQDILNMTTVSQSQEKQNKDALSKSNSAKNVTTTRNVKKDVKITHSKHTPTCIPETNDSFSFVQSANAVSSIQNINNMQEQEIVENDPLRQSLELKKHSSVILVDDEQIVEEERLNAIERIEHLNQITLLKKPHIVSKMPDNTKFRDPIIIDIENSEEDDMFDECNTNENDTFELSCLSDKRVFSNDPDTKNTRNKDVSLDSSNCSGSTIQTTPNYKKFKKAPVTIPKHRIGLNDMFVCERYMIR